MTFSNYLPTYILNLFYFVLIFLLRSKLPNPKGMLIRISSDMMNSKNLHEEYQIIYKWINHLLCLSLHKSWTNCNDIHTCMKPNLESQFSQSNLCLKIWTLSIDSKVCKVDRYVVHSSICSSELMWNTKNKLHTCSAKVQGAIY